MKRIAPLVAILSLLSPAGAFAACPPLATGTSADIVKANEQRLLCLNQELAAQTRLRQQDLDLKAMEQSLQNLQLQQRLNALPVYTPPSFNML